MAFQAPVAEIAATLTSIAGRDQAIPGDIDIETVKAILAEAGRFAENELAPLNRVGDRQGVRLADGEVTTAPGWGAAYRHFAAAGWSGVGAEERWGGQGLPVVVEMAVQDIWNAGSAAFALGPMLTTGAISALEAHADPVLQAVYLPKLVSGEWMATMNLTEPQAGSDLNALSARAERVDDGTYRITGQKIFISYGEHDLTENIVHLVLARLPDAPLGTAGISLFVVPKFVLEADGTPSRRNDVRATGLEHKLGMHGAPTCTMTYESAVGHLVGEEHRGLACMFTMMNVSRLSVGIQAVGIAERACQEALAYAAERRQGRAPGWRGKGMSPIVHHPDVQAMLLRMTAITAASRAICYSCAHAIDMSRRGREADRQSWAHRAALLTPIAKAFATDAGIEVASLGIQVHGGAGYIEETGAAQHLRDVRVLAIYEGTNGIQAIDFTTRKLPLDDGDAFRRLVVDIEAMIDGAETARNGDLKDLANHLRAAVGDVEAATGHVTAAMRNGRRREALAGATATLRLTGLTFGAALLAERAARPGDAGQDQKAVAMARYFAETMLGETTGLCRSVLSDSGARAAAILFPSSEQIDHETDGARRSES